MTQDLRRYLDRPMTPPDPEVVAAIDAGPIDPRLATDRAGLDRLLDPTPLTAETGWCRMADRTGYAAVRTAMPQVTGDMIDWWFDWHQRDPIRYQLWFPGAHRSTSYTPAPQPAARPHWHTVHYPVEDVGLGMTKLRIAFLPPTHLGFSTDALDDPRVATIVGGLVGEPRRHLQHTVMVHVFLNSDGGGLVQRSRFWLGGAIAPYGPRPIRAALGRALNTPAVRRIAVPDKAPRVMAEHCAAEYANLAAILPELHARFA